MARVSEPEAACRRLGAGHSVPGRAATGGGRSLADRRLIDVISELEAHGVAVLYSSDLVRPWMRVREEPRAAEPHAVLAEIVAPLGLAVQARAQW